ncbi:MAG: transposase zinc-binding domain-containing protein [Polyangiaceae bacterium]|nr:transposase zinc-binding domain-containing protein [Polyangiaceae bacterium]
MAWPPALRSHSRALALRHRPEGPCSTRRWRSTGGVPRARGGARRTAALRGEGVRGALRCGRLEHGCLHLVCRECGYSELVAFSCKQRGFCPPASVGGWRTPPSTWSRASCRACPFAIGSAHCPGDCEPCSATTGLCAEVVSAFMAEVDRSLRWRAKRQLGLASVADAHTGGVAAVQRTDSALRLNVHFHSLVLDGVYVHENDDPRSPLEFRELDTPTRTDIAEVAARTAARVESSSSARQEPRPELVEDTPPELALDEPGLAACYAAAAQGLRERRPRWPAAASPHRLARPTARPAPSMRPTSPSQRCAVSTSTPCRSWTGGTAVAWSGSASTSRAPVAQDRLERRADGKLELTFRGVARRHASARVRAS